MAATVPTARVTNSRVEERNPQEELSDCFCCSAIKIPAGARIATASGPASRATVLSKLTDIQRVRTTTTAPTISCAGINQASGQSFGSFGSFGSRSDARSFSQFGSHRANKAANRTKGAAQTAKLHHKSAAPG